ncbi:MAG TPA: HK97-gp10 family putative phage morphogenesis protein [Sphingomicrobium sp.]|jgi:HK97 gp10 family phage protein
MARKRFGGSNRIHVGRAQLQGFDELAAALASLSRGVERNVLKRAGVRAMGIVVERAQSLVPVRTGALRGSIMIETKTLRDAGFRAAWAQAKREGRSTRGIRAEKGAKGSVRVQVVAGGQGARHATLIEFGTSKMAARPFLRPAFDNTSNMVLSSLYDALGTEIDKAVKRRDRRAAAKSRG